MSIHTPICDLFGIDHPVFLAGMGGVSYAELCAAVSEAGGLGCLGMAGVSPRGIRAEMRRVRELTAKPFAVDLLAALPEQMNAAIDVIIEEGACCFVAGLGVPADLVDKLHAAGLKVMVVCGTVRHAVKAEQAGVDAVIAQGTEAGGHTGRVAGMALIPQTVDAVSIPVLAAGSIVDGRGLAAALAFGAEGVWMGTRFIATREAQAAAIYKQRLVEASEEDTVITRCYTGKTLRALANPYIAEWERRPQDIQSFPAQAMASGAAGVIRALSGETDGIDPARDCLPAGQGTGAIRDVPAAGDIVRRVMAEAETVLGRIGRYGRPV